MAYLPLNSVRNITNATAKLGGLAFDGVTSGAGDTHTIASIGTSDATISVKVLAPSANPSVSGGIVLLSSSSTTYDVARSWYVYVAIDGSLTVKLTGATNADTLAYALSGFVSSYGGKIVDIALVKNSTAGTLTVYINGVAQTLSTYSSGTPPTYVDTVTSTYAIVGKLSSSLLFNSTIYSATLFNRALSASEVITLANQGVQEADKWGSLTAKYTSNFSTGVDGWAALRSTINYGVTYNAESDCFSAYANAINSTHGVYSIPSATLTAGKRFRLSFGYAIPSGQSNVNGIGISPTSGVGDPYFIINGTTYSNASSPFNITATADGTWRTYSVDIQVSTSGNGAVTNPVALIIQGLKSGSASFAGADSPTDDLFYLKNIVVTQIGSILDADLSAGVGYQVPDRSSNNYRGLISTSGTTWTLPRKTGQAIYTIAASGYLGDGTSRAIIPDNARIDNIQAYSTSGSTFSIGDDSGSPTNVIGSTTVSAATLTDLGTPAKRFLTTGTDGRLYVTFSAANSTVFTINYSLAPTS